MAQLVTDTIKFAIKNNSDIKPETMHNDQGSAYTRGLYNTFLAGKSIIHSMPHPSTPENNSSMESFWSHLKTERFVSERALSEVEMIKHIENSIHWYNCERRQETVNGMTPMEHRNHVVKEIA